MIGKIDYLHWAYTNPSLPSVKGAFSSLSLPCARGGVSAADGGVVMRNNPSPASRELPLHKGACETSSLPCARGGVSEADGGVVKGTIPRRLSSAAPFTQGGLEDKNMSTCPWSCYATPYKGALKIENISTCLRGSTLLFSHAKTGKNLRYNFLRYPSAV